MEQRSRPCTLSSLAAGVGDQERGVSWLSSSVDSGPRGDTTTSPGPGSRS